MIVRNETCIGSGSVPHRARCWGNTVRGGDIAFIPPLCGSLVASDCLLCDTKRSFSLTFGSFGARAVYLIREQSMELITALNTSELGEGGWDRIMSLSRHKKESLVVAKFLIRYLIK